MEALAKGSELTLLMIQIMNLRKDIKEMILTPTLLVDVDAEVSEAVEDPADLLAADTEVTEEILGENDQVMILMVLLAGCDAWRMIDMIMDPTETLMDHV